jgi:hypothetical protein
MSKVKSITLHPLDPPPGMSPDTYYCKDGEIVGWNDEVARFPVIIERSGRTEAELEQVARDELTEKGNRFFPEPPVEAPEA